MLPTMSAGLYTAKTKSYEHCQIFRQIHGELFLKSH